MTREQSQRICLHELVELFCSVHLDVDGFVGDFLS